MPYKDPDKRRAATRERMRRLRARRGLALEPLVVEEGTPAPPSRDELLRVLGVQARTGNVAAIRLLLEEYRRREGVEAEPSPVSFLEELRARRRAREDAKRPS